MGLDMYLSKHHYVKNWEHSLKKYTVTVQEDSNDIAGLDLEKVKYIIEEAGYWRKANAIHYWFVNNIQDGEDNCEEYCVDDNKIEELLNLCQEVVKVAIVEKGKVANGYSYNDKMEKVYEYEDGETITNPQQVAEILPTESGFFFGSTEYDQYYLQDIKDTIEILEPLVQKDVDGNYINKAEVYYRSSW